MRHRVRPDLEFAVIHDLLSGMKIADVADRHGTAYSNVRKIKANWPLFFWNFDWRVVYRYPPSGVPKITHQ